MLLYHGTKESHLQSILERGLQPRPADSQGNHAGTVADLKSRDGIVYLSSWCPVQYAEHANGEGRLLIVEVDLERLPEDKMVPDEDALVHEILSEENLGRPDYLQRFKQLIGNIDTAPHRDRWMYLLQRGGSVGFEGAVPVSAFTRYALIDMNAGKKFNEVFRTIMFALSNGTKMTAYIKALTPYVWDGNAGPMVEGLEPVAGEELRRELTEEWPKAFLVEKL